MAMTALQWHAKRRREAARRMAWLDGRAKEVGRLDGLLHHADNPYPKDSRQAEEWREGRVEYLAQEAKTWGWA
jgi:hypothetical protein